MLTKKFIEGMTYYAQAWSGPLTAVMMPVERAGDNLDNVTVDPATLPFTVEPVLFGSKDAMAAKLRGAGVVLGGPDRLARDLSALCRSLGVASVYNTEYTLTTRLQIISQNTKNVLRRVRRFVWELTEEFGHYRGELGVADGVQCNGTPTYDAYRTLTPRPLLYFDTRVYASEVASDAHVERANLRRRQPGKLRLAFSGRLNAMKGAGDLVRVADQLRRRGVDFEMSIFGSGALEAEMKEDIRRLGLEREVKLEGVLEFHSELLPRMRDSVDLFVCCHPQGDPSCTYLETMSAGVPIVGYANEAFEGLTRLGRIGWAVPLGDVARLADEIARLSRDRQELATTAMSALAFAREHTFESTFRRRIDHLREVMGDRRAA